MFALASALATGVHAQTIGCTVGSANGGSIPTSGSGGGGAPPPNAMVGTLNVASLPPGATVLTEVKLIGLTHTYGADLQWVLTDPAGNTHNLIGQANGYCDYGGDYTIVGQCIGGVPFPTCTGAPVPTGVYEQFFGAHVSGTYGILNTPLNAIPAQTGTWTLTCYDWYGGDTGFLSSWDLCFGTPPSPSVPTAAPTLTNPANASTVTLPTNLTWNTVNCASTYDLDLDGTVTTGLTSTSFALSSATVGSHTWSVRGVNASGPGPWSAPSTFDVPPPPPVTTCVNNGTGAGVIPTTGSGGGGVWPSALPPNQYASTYNVSVPPGATAIGKVELVGLTHTFLGDLHVVLTDPSGVQHNVLHRPGSVSGSFGLGCDLGGDYSIYESGQLTWGCSGVTTNPGAYNQDFGTWTSGDLNIFNTPLSAIPVVSGNWTLSIYDWAGGDVGSINDWKLCFSAPTGPVAYCTAGTTTNGCSASISGSNNPSVTAANPCTISVANVEGQKSGLIFYSVTGQQAVAWNATSFLCVKAPTQRTATQVSGGTTGQCNGTLSLDWNAFQAANPTALGNPFSAGNQVQVQAWFRDPPAGKSTNLSNAIEMTYAP